jgi:hypothetical protein
MYAPQPGCVRGTEAKQQTFMALSNCPGGHLALSSRSLPGASHHFHMEALEIDRLKGHTAAIASPPAHMQAPTHHPVDRLLPQSSLQRMKRLLERKDGAGAKAPRAGT